MQSFISRECTNAVNFGALPKKTVKRHLKTLTKKSRIVLICGLVLKDDMFESIFSDIYSDRSFSFWNRDKVLDMLSPDPFKMMKDVRQLEYKQMEKMLKKKDSISFFQGTYSSPREREHFINFEPGVRKICLVVDESPQFVKEHFMNCERFKSMHKIIREEADYYYEKKMKSYKWPKISEGWDGIYYISFREDSVEHLQNTLRMI